MAGNRHQTALDEGGFLTKEAVTVMAASTRWRMMMVLIRCGSGRMSVPTQDVNHFIGIIDSDKRDYVRDVCLIAGTLDAGPARTELRELLGAIA